MIELIPFKIEHAKEIRIRDADSDIRRIGGDLWYDILKKSDNRGPAYTGIINGQVMGFGGISLYWPGVGEAWAVYDKDVCKYPVTAFKWSKRILELIISDKHLHRVQATTDSKFNSAHRWLESLGFECSALLKKYTPTQDDALLWSITRD